MLGEIVSEEIQNYLLLKGQAELGQCGIPD